MNSAATEKSKETLLKLPLILAAKADIPDFGCDFAKPPVETDATLRRAKISVFGFPEKNEACERQRLRKEPRNRLPA